MNKNKNGTREGNENEMNKWTGNRIGDEGKAHLTEALNVNSTLTELSIWDKSI